MLGINFIKYPPTTYVMQYENGRVKREGVGLSFFYYSPTTSLVGVPVGSVDAPFMFEELTLDFQKVTIQGQSTYRIADPKKISALLNFSLDLSGKKYVSDDPEKLTQRIINIIKVMTRQHIQNLSLRDALKAQHSLVNSIFNAIANNAELISMGIEVLGFSILAIKATPEAARALEAEAREQILQEADDAIYARRNAAVEQERKIKENELNTEIAVEAKKRQIREAQMEAERSLQEKKHEMQQTEMDSKIKLEEKNKELVILASENAKQEADVNNYALSGTMKTLSQVDSKVIEALAMTGMQPSHMIAMAFKGLTEKAGQIGQLNITPDLLRELLDKKDK